MLELQKKIREREKGPFLYKKRRRTEKNHQMMGTSSEVKASLTDSSTVKGKR